MYSLNKILQNIASQNNLNLIEAKPLSGGDINEIFLLKCEEESFVVKLNDATKFPGMFKAEANGLQLLRNSQSFRIPEVIATDHIENTSYLLMVFLPEGNKTRNFWHHFASNLAKLHQVSQPYFGLDHDNYIGSLPQQNVKWNTASEFYISQRLEPQFKMALQHGFSFKNLDSFYKNISEEIPDEPSSLIHGDLWGGNYMVSTQGESILIDPAVAYASREMDIGMMQLFGGFSEEVFVYYNSIFPLKPNWEDRLPLWQLYYLLVHLNLFGSGYLRRVKSVVSKHS